MEACLLRKWVGSLHESIKQLPDGLMRSIIPEKWTGTILVPDFLFSEDAKVAVEIFKVRRYTVALHASAHFGWRPEDVMEELSIHHNKTYMLGYVEGLWRRVPYCPRPCDAERDYWCPTGAREQH
jgi:hypothetical protein